MFDAKTTARMLGWSVKTLYRRSKNGTGPKSRKWGGGLAWSADTIFQFLKSGGPKLTRRRGVKGRGRKAKERKDRPSRKAQKKDNAKVYKRVMQRVEMLIRGDDRRQK